MSEEIKESISRIQIDLDNLKSNSPTNRDFDRIELQISQLKDSIASISLRLENAREVDLSPAIQAIEKVGDKTDTVFHKIPPLPSLIAAAVIVIGVLGLSYSDLQTLSKPIKEASEEVASTTATLKTSILEVKQDFEGMSEFSKDLSSNLEKIGNLDRAIAKMLAEVQRISSSANIVSTKRPSENNEQSVGIESLLESLGSDLPPTMRLLMDARAAIANFEYAKARELASKAKSLDSDKSESVYDNIIASSYYEEGKYREAIGAYLNAVDLEPNVSSFHNNLGSSYWALSKEVKDKKERKDLREKSIAATKKSISLDPTSPEVYANGAIVINSLGRYDDAIELLNAWEGPPSAKIVYQKAATSSLAGKAAETISDLSEAIKLDRKYALHAAADDDFSSMRNNEGFRTLIKTNLGDRIFSAVIRTWNK